MLKIQNGWGNLIKTSLIYKGMAGAHRESRPLIRPCFNLTYANNNVDGL